MAYLVVRDPNRLPRLRFEIQGAGHAPDDPPPEVSNCGRRGGPSSSHGSGLSTLRRAYASHMLPAIGGTYKKRLKSHLAISRRDFQVPRERSTWSLSADHYRATQAPTFSLSLREIERNRPVSKQTKPTQQVQNETAPEVSDAELDGMAGGQSLGTATTYRFAPSRFNSMS